MRRRPVHLSSAIGDYGVWCNCGRTYLARRRGFRHGRECRPLGWVQRVPAGRPRIAHCFNVSLRAKRGNDGSRGCRDPQSPAAAKEGGHDAGILSCLAGLCLFLAQVPQPWNGWARVFCPPGWGAAVVRLLSPRASAPSAVRHWFWSLVVYSR
jgi:hypothetical protein